MPVLSVRRVMNFTVVYTSSTAAFWGTAENPSCRTQYSLGGEASCSFCTAAHCSELKPNTNRGLHGAHEALSLFTGWYVQNLILTLWKSIFVYTQLYCRQKRYWSKTAAQWAVTDVKRDRSYSYTPELQKAIIDAKLRDSLPIRWQIPLDEEDPRRTARSIAPDPPLPTKEIKEKKISRL